MDAYNPCRICQAAQWLFRVCGAGSWDELYGIVERNIGDCLSQAQRRSATEKLTRRNWEQSQPEEDLDLLTKEQAISNTAPKTQRSPYYIIEARAKRHPWQPPALVLSRHRILVAG